MWAAIREATLRAGQTAWKNNSIKNLLCCVTGIAWTAELGEEPHLCQGWSVKEDVNLSL